MVQHTQEMAHTDIIKVQKLTLYAFGTEAKI